MKLAVERTKEGQIIDIACQDSPGELLLWVDIAYTSDDTGYGISIKVQKTPFLTAVPFRFAVDACQYLTDLTDRDNVESPERFVQVVRRKLQDRVLSTGIGTTLAYTGLPKLYKDGDIYSRYGILSPNNGERSYKIANREVPEGTSLPLKGEMNEYEENYEDDFMLTIAVGMLDSSAIPHGMRLVRNDLGQLRLYLNTPGNVDEQPLSVEEKGNYRLVFTYASRLVMGNYQYRLARDALGALKQICLSLPTDQLDVLPEPNPDDDLEPEPTEGDQLPPSRVPLAIFGGGGLPSLPKDDDDDKKNPTGLEKFYPFQLRGMEANDDEEEELDTFRRRSVDPYTGKKIRQRDPPTSPADDNDERKYPKTN